MIRLSNGEIIKVDKMLHFSISYIIASLFTNPWFGMGIVIGVNLLKEIFDIQIKKSKFDLVDIISGVLGGMIYFLTRLL